MAPVLLPRGAVSFSADQILRWKAPRALRLDWRSTNSPLRLIEGQLGGSVIRQLEKDGVTCRLEFPVRAVVTPDEQAGVARK